jgi:hypothetical protein
MICEYELNVNNIYIDSTLGDDEVLRLTMTVVGIVNDMIGGIILILPVMALNAGYILTLIVIFVSQ